LQTRRLCTPRYLPPADGPKWHSGESQHPQLPGPQVHNIRGPGIDITSSKVASRDLAWDGLKPGPLGDPRVKATGPGAFQARALPLSHDRCHCAVSRWHVPPPLAEVPLPSSPAPVPLVLILPRKLPSKLLPAPYHLEMTALGTLAGAPTSEGSESQRTLPAQRPSNFKLR
jgi:hypothetical protein